MIQPPVRRPVLALAAGLSALLLGCRPAVQAPEAQPPQAQAGRADRPRVVTTFLPITLFTRAVAGDCAEVSALIPAASGPHDFQARPGDVAALKNARVLVKNGLEMESFLDKLVKGAENPDLKVIDSSRGIATLENPEASGESKAEAHDDHGHDHAHDHGPINPHIWLDPVRAAQQVDNIRDGLIAADPACADGYRRNAAAFSGQLRQLNTDFEKQLAPFRGKTFVVLHDFAPYFADRYGLRAEYLVDVPEQNPSPADLARVAETVKRTQLKALLSEPQEGNRSFNALAGDLGIRISVFDPMETGTEEASRNPATYAEVMRRNVSDLVSAFR
ncbi:metal ABC transporter solute-binding protein, Zn/Mn family [Cyanobium gracile]|uniref:ABC-type metal ion transport system, periplasmic component/surface adhesin n=1 Tax=Cyanobium gracile (strain ATCC 27147 / PCC 6307) TaxID=292564 RepID=K9P5J8_CYAGP|nr:zinc ABC transporter substrate-binding protein [Cyanobium gracile]AFY28273.1 ABC-type metal ion transport system, periplasmic component/surface adhesin [Cyanobium gracile PCC 6307]